MMNNDIAGFYIDTMITSIYTKRNLIDLDANQFGIFNAGKYAEIKKRNDYLSKFSDLQMNNYYFIPAIFESSGGINRELRFLLNTLIKGLYPKNKHGVKIHNYHIELSIRLKRLLYGSLYDHYSMI